MAIESVATSHMLPLDLIDEANAICSKATAVLECLGEGIKHLDSPEHVVPGITWLVSDQIVRLKEIINTRQEA